jgi:uncharacterized protein (DUF1810 family)
MRLMSDADSQEPDPHALHRFVEAQSDMYDRALAEIRGGRKTSHWMWFVFPQFDGLGFSATSRFYAIKSVDEARAYLAHPVLGPRLLESASAVLEHSGVSAHQMFGSPDDMKLRSCATLFASVTGRQSVFQQILDRYFDGQRDPRTLRLIE